MCAYPKTYNKEDFLVFLEDNDVSEDIITKFVELPETVTRSGNVFTLDVDSTWYNVDDTHYSFELNYYSRELIEYLFASKVFTDIEVCINNLVCELRIANYIKNKE